MVLKGKKNWNDIEARRTGTAGWAANDADNDETAESKQQIRGNGH
jgi:hypothetical protein